MKTLLIALYIIFRPLIHLAIRKARLKALMTKNIWLGRSVMYRMHLRGSANIGARTSHAAIIENFFESKI